MNCCSFKRWLTESLRPLAKSLATEENKFVYSSALAGPCLLLYQREELDKPVLKFEWKEIVELVMQQYPESTDGSYIEWKRAPWSVLANQPVSVKSGAHIIEVKPHISSHSLINHHLSCHIL